MTGQCLPRVASALQTPCPEKDSTMPQGSPPDDASAPAPRRSLSFKRKSTELLFWLIPHSLIVGEKSRYSLIRSYAREMVDLRQVFVWIGKRLIAVLPNKEIDLGEVEVDDHIMVKELNVPRGHHRDWSAHVEKAGKFLPEDRDKRGLISSRAGRSPNWVKVKNPEHPTISRVKNAFGA